MSRLPLGKKFLRRLFDGIPPAKDYFYGMPGLSIPPIQEVLVFTRRLGSQLRRVPNLHPRFVLAISLMGRGHLVIDGEPHDLGPGEAFLILPHQFHHYLVHPKETLRWVFISFNSKPDPFWEHHTNRVLPLTPPSLAVLKEALSASAFGKTPFPIFALAVATILVCGATPPKPMGRHALATMDPLLSNLLAKFRDEPHLRPTVLALSEKLGVSRTTLQNRFKKQLGIPLAQFLRDMAVKRASSLLSGSKKSIGEVAIETGFPTVFSFSRTFRNIMGVSPRQFREGRGK